MIFMTLPAPVSGREALRRAGPRLRARLLPPSPESMDGIPYYDDELAMAQSIAHIQTILYLGPLLNRVAQAAGLRWVSDHPVWCWIAEEEQTPKQTTNSDWSGVSENRQSRSYS